MSHGGARPGAGRKKGGHNRPHTSHAADLRAYLAQQNADPHCFMVDIMQDATLSAGLRFQAARELAQYLSPKLKAIEHSGQMEILEKLQRLDTCTDEELDQIIAYAE